jgi:hypothetical protein
VKNKVNFATYAQQSQLAALKGTPEKVHDQLLYSLKYAKNNMKIRQQ